MIFFENFLKEFFDTKYKGVFPVKHTLINQGIKLNVYLITTNLLIPAISLFTVNRTK